MQIAPLISKVINMGIWDYITVSGIKQETKAYAESKRNELAKEVRQMAKEANKRLDDLAKSEIASPAYSQWVRNGETRFGVIGKTYQQVQSEYWRIKNFLDAKTSTVQGAKAVLDDIARNVGYRGEMTSDKAREFFRLANRIKDYYKMTGQSARALDYQLIWENINIAIEKAGLNLDAVELSVKNIEDLLDTVDGLNKEIKALETIPDNEQGIEQMASNPPTTIMGQVGRAVKSVASKVASGIQSLFAFLTK